MEVEGEERTGCIYSNRSVTGSAVSDRWCPSGLWSMSVLALGLHHGALCTRAHTHTHIDTHRHSDRHTHTDIYTQTDTDTHTQKHRHRDTHTGTHTQTHTHTETYRNTDTLASATVTDVTEPPKAVCRVGERERETRGGRVKDRREDWAGVCQGRMRGG